MGQWVTLIVFRMVTSFILNSGEENSRSYLRGPLQSKEPGSLGAIAESLRQAGLDCDIRIGDWSSDGPWRVDLSVWLKPTEQS